MRPIALWDYRFDSLTVNGCLSPVNVVFCQIEFSATGRYLIQRNPTEYGVSEYDRETPTISLLHHEKRKVQFLS